MRPRLSNRTRGVLLGGRYCLNMLLGRSDVGSTYEGRHVHTGRLVTVTILHATRATDVVTVERFLHDAQATQTLEHPNIANVLDVGRETDGAAFVVLDRLDGRSLSELLRDEGALSFERAATILLPTMRALALTHARGVSHQGLSPESIFLHHDTEGGMVPKVLNAGIARTLRRKTRNEVARCEAYDVYHVGDDAVAVVRSMGMVWYATLTGRRPDEGSPPLQALALRGLAPEVAAVLDGALTRDAVARHADMGAFLAALMTALEHAAAPLPLEATPLLRETVAPSVASRRMLPHVALASLLVAVGVLTVFGASARYCDVARPTSQTSLVASPSAQHVHTTERVVVPHAIPAVSTGAARRDAPERAVALGSPRRASRLLSPRTTHGASASRRGRVVAPHRDVMTAQR